MNLRTLSLVLLLAGGVCAPAREVTVTLWISGGAEGILDGGRVAPGWLGLLTELGQRGESEPWIDVGGTRHLDALFALKDLRPPQMVVPGESLLRIRGVEILETEQIPWVISNAAILPQFPDAEVPAASEWRWKHPDGAPVRVLGLLSDQAPLRIPASRLRPLQILPARETLRSMYLEPQAQDVLELLILPEGAEGKEWSRQFPDADIVVEPATGGHSVVELDGGTRLRVRPGRFGRSVIRVWARWDTVTRTFSSPRAEAVWIPQCTYTDLNLPEDMVAHLRNLETVHLAERVDVMWIPELEAMDSPSERPDAIRAQRVPEDDAWMIAQVPASRWPEWASVEDARWSGVGGRIPRSPRVALPAIVAAGRGDWDCPIRQDLVSGAVEGEWTGATTRALVLSDQRDRP